MVVTLLLFSSRVAPWPPWLGDRHELAVLEPNAGPPSGIDSSSPSMADAVAVDELLAGQRLIVPTWTQDKV